jgi:dUTP pyrophosphatase
VTATVNIKRLPHHEGLALPSYQTSGSAGMDLTAAIAEGEVVTLAPGERRAIPTGLAIALPPSLEAQVRPRSGLALKQGVTVANAPGTVDSDYRGEIQAILINLGQAPFEIRRGDRIAQMVIAPVVQIAWNDVADLDATERGAGGFGSTGV